MFIISYMRGDVYAWVLLKLKDYFKQGTKSKYTGTITNLSIFRKVTKVI